jgi:hypothetical protein
MKATIDRIEDGIAVLEIENGKMIEIPACHLENFKEGDVLEITFSKDEKTTYEKEKNIKEKLKNLFDN